MKKSKTNFIKYECKQFCIVFSLGEEKRVELERLALEDYKKCSAKDKGNWSLKALTARLRLA